MEQHPVPQNIKSFQFKLIGDMTLRQFAFLASGLVIAYVTFMLPINSAVKWTIMISSSLFGAGCAFFPINERPLDQWIISFFKAIFSPTQMIWRKNPEPLLYTQFTPTHKTPPSTSPAAGDDRKKLEQYLAGLPKKGEALLAEEEKKFLTKIQPILAPGEEEKISPPEEKIQKPSLAAGNLLLTQPILKIQDLETSKPKHIPSLSGTRVRKLGSKSKAAQAPKSVPVEIPVTLSRQPAAPLKEIFTKTEEITKMAKEEVIKVQKMEDYQQEIEKLKAEKECLLRDVQRKQEGARKARQAVARMTRQPAPKTGPTARPAPLSTTTVPKKAPPATQPIKKLVLLKITDQPNIVTGIVADQQGNLLEEAIIVVKDQDGTPVRALKTNSLGQFATATPLANGVYSVEAEKEGCQFDIIYQEVKGGVVPPLEIRSR